jgi:BirA family biotin operon repressor/biotin-[acetyl-CoA-carboxylase] ligase
MAISEDISFIDQAGNIMLFYTPVCKSTQNSAHEIAATGNFKLPFAIYTLEQTLGRGQQNRNWISEPGLNLALTMAVELNKNQQPVLLNKALSLACLQTIRELGIQNAEIKWPNDIRVDGSKIAGILMESTPLQKRTLLLAGFGININQLNFNGIEQSATSVKLITGSDVSIAQAALLLCQNLNQAILRFQEEDLSISEDFDSNLEGRGKSWLVQGESPQPFTATLLGTDEYGRVNLKMPNGQIHAYHHGLVRIMKKIEGNF